MSMFITSLNSGSNGNCYYIGNHHEAVLVDAGLSCRETEKRMYRLGLSMKMIKAVFISHEHGDHIKGLSEIAGKYELPVYITCHTARYCCLPENKALIREFSAYQPVNIGSLSVTAFPKQHDAADPHSFVISCDGITIGVFTDIGIACARVTSYFNQCHAAFLEANYDEDLLEKGRYPRFLKNRISGTNGHLSNKQALEVFINHRPPFMTHLLLSHLSQNNNNPQMVQQLFTEYADGVNIIVASRCEQTAIYTIQQPVTLNHSYRVLPFASFAPKQLTLF